MSDPESPAVYIRERENDDEDYRRPSILEEDSPNGSDSASSESEDDVEEESESDSEDEVEDDTAALLTADVDTQILKTIAAIRNKDPRVYDPNTRFIDEKALEDAEKEWEKKQEEVRGQAKKVTLRDYEHEVNVQYGGIVPEDEEKDLPMVKTHYEEQEDLKNAFKMAAEVEDEEGEEGFLQKRDKTEEELKAEEEDYKNFLLANLSNDTATAATANEWRNIKKNANISEEDAFLMDFVLNRGWVDKAKAKSGKDIVDEPVDKDADEQHLDEVDRFESKYNFRFEEEGSSNIIGHSREVEGTLRRKERKRQLQRERKKAKKEAAKKQKLEELSRMRNQKMKEIHDRLKEIQEITGNDSIGLDKIDLEGDFDPATYDEQMSKLFDDEYYGAEDTEKPQWADDIEGVEDMDEDEPYTHGKNDDDDEEDIMMDADYLPGGEKYMASHKRKRGEAEEAEVSGSKKDTKKKFKELLDEYYSLNFEDIVGGDLPTRYKYRKTEAEDFGLSATDILLADDAELNKFVGLKQLAPYRAEEKAQIEKKRFKKQKKYKLRELQKHLRAKGYDYYGGQLKDKDDKEKKSKDRSDKDKDKKKRKSKDVEA